ncbi:uncharacterized GPI-anchored protein At1g61900-like isoform X1 [Malus domestica]|uniref:uncharacterized GPI-anchored protein At1g61900-like isoform X1 n=1 Tax=Malus domestica TaxID=3750 RepID=UPI0010AAAF5F|nr:uncharacterized GPI-anchored protein At1g61900-like isoform X1 [Malus domestica]
MLKLETRHRTNARMRERVSHIFLTLLLLLCVYESHCDPVRDAEAVAPDVATGVNPQPFLPLLAPSPLTPFTNNSVPALSGLCTLNFSAAVNMMTITATDCWAFFAPLLADVVCCPQFDATLATLIGHSSKSSGMLSLNATHAKHCLSDVEKILEGQGANENIQKICSIRPENLTAASCPVTEVDMFESTVDSSKLLAACKNVDPVNECCDQVCQNAILDASRTIAAIGMPTSEGVHEFPEHSTRIDDCKNIVLRWLAGNLDPSSVNKTLRGLSSCKVNKVCPLVFPNMTRVVKECANVIRNETACCNAMDSYVSRLQEQSFITNLQALNCAASLGEKLLKANVSNVYNLCHINLKDFSLQVGSQEYGCLLPSLPLDATYDKTSGISFICDLNDNVAAPWPSLSSESPSSCKKTTKIPAVPKATSAQSGLHTGNLMLLSLLSSPWWF